MASRWVTAHPQSHATRLKDMEYRFVARLRLGIPPIDIMPGHCPACGKLMDDDPDHYLICVYTRSNECSTRHDQVVALLKRAVDRAGGLCKLEPYRSLISQVKPPPSVPVRSNSAPLLLGQPVPSTTGTQSAIQTQNAPMLVSTTTSAVAAIPVDSDEAKTNTPCLRVDAEVTLDDKFYQIDVSIVHPTATSHIPAALSSKPGQKTMPLTVGRKREAEKIKKYAAKAAREHATFIPFVAETYGGICEQALEFIKTVSTFADDTQTCWSHAEFRNEWLDSIAIAIQRGNARDPC
jgi:hypothetical protein